MYGYRGSSNRPQIHNPALRSFGSCVNGTSRQFFGKSGNGFCDCGGVGRRTSARVHLWKPACTNASS